MDSEQSARLLLIGGVVAIVLLAIGFIAFGWYWTEKRPLGRTVLKVDEYNITYAAMKRRMNYEFFRSSTLQQNPTDLPTIAYDNLVDELIRVARADTLGVTLDDATFDQKLRTRIGVAADADQRAFQDGLRGQINATGLNESEFRRLVLAESLETAIKDKFTAELPPVILQARVEVISAPTIEEAQSSIDRINAGEAFADVAKEVSQETDVATTGGVHDYTPDGSLNAAYNDYAFSGEVGALSAPLPGTTGGTTHYVVRVLDRSDQPIREEQRAALAQTKFDDWLAATKAELGSSGALVNKWDEKAQSEALLDVYTDAQPTLDEQRHQQEEQQAEQQQQQQTAVAALTANPAPPTTEAAPGTPAPETTPAAESSPGLEASPAVSTGDGVTPPSQPVAPSTP
jgi:hypothetical protein